MPCWVWSGWGTLERRSSRCLPSMHTCMPCASIYQNSGLFFMRLHFLCSVSDRHTATFALFTSLLSKPPNSSVPWCLKNKTQTACLFASLFNTCLLLICVCGGEFWEEERKQERRLVCVAEHTFQQQTLNCHHHPRKF